MKNIVICADGTWNRPEENLAEDVPTNVLKVARAVAPVDDKRQHQVVFYDWGIGSYYDSVKGGAFGDGINKNVMDCYRFIVQNYDPGDQLYFFGFSRGAYTVRSLSGLIYNCGILKRWQAKRIAQAYEMYRSPDVHPESQEAADYRRKYSVASDIRVRFIGVWDTVGSLGIPIRMLGFLNERHLFHDNKIGPNVDCARHALAIDELRDDFRPTIWKQRRGMDLKQVWFPGVHSDVGGGYRPGRGGKTLADIPLKWILGEARKNGLEVESHLFSKLKPDPLADQHEEYEGFFKVLGKHERPIARGTYLHSSVRERYEGMSSYRPPKLVAHVRTHGWNHLLKADT